MHDIILLTSEGIFKMGGFLSRTKKSSSPIGIRVDCITINSKTTTKELESKVPTKITTLTIDSLSNKIDITALFAKLKGSTLTHISLVDADLNGKEDTFYKELSTLLQSQTGITDLNLKNCKLTLEQLKMLSDGIKKQSNLSSLTISENACVDGDRKQLENFLKEMHLPEKCMIETGINEIDTKLNPTWGKTI